jgi:hypothetical protein
MGKKHWKRVSLADLADEKTQKQILDLISQASEQPEPELPCKRPSEKPEAER